MSDRPLIILTLDGFARSSLGCYGSSWNQTPAIDAIAGTGCVWDRRIAATDEPAKLLISMISDANDALAGWQSLGSVELITDVAAVASESRSFRFEHIETLSACDPPAQYASDIVDTQLGALISAAIDRDARPDQWSVLWLHSDFLTRCWDAPRDLAPLHEDEQCDLQTPTDEVELLEAEPQMPAPYERLPPVFDCVAPPAVSLNADSHPDLIVTWMRTYACQVRLVDLLIEVLLSSIRSDDPCLILAGTSGFRLGQGGWIGHRVGPLRSADIHLPLIVSDCCGPLRMPQLAQANALQWILDYLLESKSVGKTLVSPEQWAEDSCGEIVTHSDRAKQSMTTTHWFHVRDLDESDHLFLKPDDIDDFNDVGRLRSDVVDQLLDVGNLQTPQKSPADRKIDEA